MNISEMWPMSNIQVIGVRKGHPQTNELITDKVMFQILKNSNQFFNSSRIFLLGSMRGYTFSD